MQENWIKLNNKAKKPNAIIAVSNYGNVKQLNGVIRAAERYEYCSHNQKHYKVSHIVMETWSPKTAEDIALGRNEVDHISYTPDNINQNDLRNLRWCTHKENTTFKEHIENLTKARRARPLYAKETKEKISKNSAMPAIASEYKEYKKNGGTLLWIEFLKQRKG